MCQKCHLQLKVDLHKPLQEMSLDALDATFPLPPHLQNEQYKQKEAEAIKLLGESFVVLPNPDPVLAKRAIADPTKTQLNDKVVALTNVFEVASNKCQYDHPICTDCIGSISKELQRRLKESTADLEVYRQNLGQIIERKSLLSNLTAEKMSKITAENDDNCHDDDNSDDEKASKALEDRLEQIRREREALSHESMLLERESNQMDVFEERFWEDYQDFELEVENVNKEYGAIRQRIKVTSQRLQRMKKTNVLADAFHISYDGHFGTINGFRLGRLPVQPVDWMETNAALGQVVLLLKILGDKMNYEFNRFKPMPMGSFSKIGRVEGSNVTVFELSGSNDLSLGRLFWYRKFDAAMEALLFCIYELGQHANAQDTNAKLTYPIDKDKINGFTIKLQFNQELKWTKALKYMLTNLKLLLAWCSKRIA